MHRLRDLGPEHADKVGNMLCGGSVTPFMVADNEAVLNLLNDEAHDTSPSCTFLFMSARQSAKRLRRRDTMSIPIVNDHSAIGRRLREIQAGDVKLPHGIYVMLPDERP